MIAQAQTSRWFGPAFLFVAGVMTFGVWQYQQWLSAPAPELTWGCGPSAGIVPAGVNLPAKPEFNWWLLVIHVLIAIAVLALSGLLAVAVKFAVAWIARIRPAFMAIGSFANTMLAQHSSNVRFFPANIFGMRAPPVVVW